ncbi:hypothetical protein T11_2210 [Trichinella zimbabwensis]|uniref:Uncharacterized protein n=1 Tax=Trichinella zimbabwensis TaxID=268475 RepID=A0A0V1HD42_9BILA|nr:hypothetical protein T11_2210 [Trichinella zimbabwensis]
MVCVTACQNDCQPSLDLDVFGSTTMPIVMSETYSIVQLIGEFTFVMYACKQQTCDDKSGDICKKRKKLLSIIRRLQRMDKLNSFFANIYRVNTVRIQDLAFTALHIANNSKVWFDSPLVYTVPQMSKEEASRIFRRCCENMDIPDGCYDLCSYDTTFMQDTVIEC